MIEVSMWKWRGLPGHFVLSDKCMFRLCTDIGDYRISTVGALYQKAEDLEMSKLGYDRHYETMVFKLKNGKILNYEELYFDSLYKENKDSPYEMDEKAESMHMRMCWKIAEMKI